MVTSEAKYAIYLRKSRADLELEAMGEGETLARHQRMLEALAQKHEIHPDQITTYKEVVSGDSIDERPEMQRLLSDVYAKQYAGVLVVEVERLARGNTKDQGEVADAFQYSGTHIITPAKVYDPNNEFDQEYFEFGLFMSRREYKTIKRRLDAGKMQSVMEGNFIGTDAPYGFDVVRKSKKERILVEKPEESQYVKMIFDWWTKDKLTLGKIAYRLTYMKVPTPSGRSAEWNRSSVEGILRNQHYIGLVRWKKRIQKKEFDPAQGKIVKTSSRGNHGETVYFKGKHDGFISKEQFDYAQTLFTGSIPITMNTVLSNIFSGILKCSDCGSVITYYEKANSGTTPRFVHRPKVTCKKKSVAAPVLIDAVIEGLKAYIKDFEIKIENDNNNDDERIRQQKMIAAMESELAKQEKRRTRLFDSYEDGAYTKEEFIERKQKYNSTIDSLKIQIQEAKSVEIAPVDYKEKITTLHRLIDCLKDPSMDAREKNNFLKQYIEEIKYDIIDKGDRKGGIPVLDIMLK